MRVLSILFFISFTASAATIPLELPSASNINALLFKEMRNYMFQVYQRSQKIALDENCRLLKYDVLERPHTKRDLKFCLTTKIESERIEQELQVQVSNRFAGSFSYIQTGKSLKPITFSQFSRFQIPETVPGIKTEFYFDHFTFGMINDRLNLPEKLDTFLLIKSFRLNFFEDQEGQIRYRNYLLSCGRCFGIPWLKVQADELRTSYYIGNEVGEVTPAYFNQKIGDYIISTYLRFGVDLKEKLIEDLNWPII